MNSTSGNYFSGELSHIRCRKISHSSSIIQDL